MGLSHQYTPKLKELRRENKTLWDNKEELKKLSLCVYQPKRSSKSTAQVSKC